jgi:hypothetical protein
MNFDSSTRILIAPDKAQDTVCPHLAPSLAVLLDSGSLVKTVYRMGWSEIDLDIHLDHGPIPGHFAGQHPLADGVETWRNEDPHYGMDEGLVCKRCRQAIAWPHATP